MKIITKANVLLLTLSTVLTAASMLFLPSIFALLLPPSIEEMLEHQSWFLFGHMYFYYLITACLYWIAGCIIGTRAKGIQDAIIKSICVGLGLFFSCMIIGSLYGGIFFLVWGLSYLLFALFGVAAVIIPAMLLSFLHSRRKLNKFALLAGSFAIMIIAYVALSNVHAGIGENAPELDYMNATPAYAGIKQQLVHDSQFQLERDPTPGREGIFVGFGSFPAIGYSSESAIMVSEFIHQHIDLQSNNEQYNIMGRVTSFSIEQSLHSLVNRRFYLYLSAHIERFGGLRENIRPMDIVIIPGMPAESYLDNGGEVVEIRSAPVALDALVFIVHKDNPVNDLSWEQLRNIYAGNITNWQELGGEDRRLKIYQRNRLSHTFRIMGELVMQGKPMTTPVQARDLNQLCAAAYQNFPESIGFCLLSFLSSDGFGIDGEYRILSIDGVYPNETTIRDGTYPFVVTFYAAIRRGEEDDAGGRFLDWILSEEGQACIRQAGYFSLR